MLRTLIATAAAVLIPSMGLTDTISLDAPYQAASLHDGEVDMVVYYIDHADHFEVVATYVSKSDLTSPNRLRMELKSGDMTNFALPGLAHINYGFTRNGDKVTVTAADRRPDFIAYQMK